METKYICYDNWKIPIERLDQMSKKELEHVHCRLQEKLTHIISNRSRFQSENTLSKNDPEFWKKMNSYRFALMTTQSQLHIVKSKIKSKNVEESNKRDKFFYVFFRTAELHLDKEQLAMLMELTINTLETTGMQYSLPDIEKEKSCETDT